MQAKGYGQSDSNFRLGVYNGIFTNGSEAFFHSSLVLAPFLAALGAPAFIIGFIPALRVGGWFLPQLFVASRLAHQPFKLPWYRRVSLVRVLAYFVMVTSIYVFHDFPQLIMIIVLAAIATVSISGGISGIPFADVTAKVVPHYRLGTFWALRNIIGGVLALLSGFLLRRILASDLPFPENFALILAIGASLAGCAYLAFSFINEPEGQVSLKQPFVSMVKRIPIILKTDLSFRRYMRVRFLALLALLADPFYAIYALQKLAAPTTALGTFIIVATASSIAANFLFRKPANEGRNVSILQISIALTLMAPIAALFISDWRFFALVFVFSAAGQAGVGVAAWNLLYAVSKAEDRPLYVGAANSLLSLPSFAPIFAGALIDFTGFRLAFIVAIAIALSAFIFSFRFKELRNLDLQALTEAKLNK